MYQSLPRSKSGGRFSPPNISHSEVLQDYCTDQEIHRRLTFFLRNLKLIFKTGIFLLFQTAVTADNLHRFGKYVINLRLFAYIADRKLYKHYIINRIGMQPHKLLIFARFFTIILRVMFFREFYSYISRISG